MATQAVENNVCRSHEAMLGGVCAGLAERFELDPIVVRILFIFMALFTVGLGAIVYVVLWVRLPRSAEPATPYEVTPESAESSSFGSVDRYTGRPISRMGAKPESSVSLLARIAIAVGLVALFLAVAINVSPMLPGTEWWQFWPVALIITGLCLIVIPISSRYGAAWHALGIVTTAAAAAFLPMALEVVAWETLPYAFTQTWFLFLAAGTMFAAGMYRQNDGLVIGSSFFVVAFFIYALAVCALPGDAHNLLFSMPDGHTVRIFFLGA